MKLTKLKRKGTRDVGELIFYICLVALPILQVAIFYFYVNFNSFLMAFQKYEPLSMSANKFSWDGLTNFKLLWKKLTYPTIWTSEISRAFVNSLFLWFLTALFGKFLAILFSYYIYKKCIFDKVFKFFLFLPSVLPGILLVILFKFFANEAIPAYALEFFGKEIGDLMALTSKSMMPSIYFFNIWAGFGAQILIYTGSMDQIAPEIIEAGEVDGVKPYQEFFFIVVPMILPTVATFMVASVATLFTNQASLYSFFGEAVELENQTLGYHMFVLVCDVKKKTDYPYASALGLVCTLIAFPLTLGMRRLLEGKKEER